MSDKIERREAIRSFKEQDVFGGLYRLANTMNGWQSQIFATPNLQGQHGKLNFAKSAKLAHEKIPVEQWQEYGPDAFVLIEMERLKKQPEQTAKEFRSDLQTLLEITLEKENAHEQYNGISG